MLPCSRGSTGAKSRWNLGTLLEGGSVWFSHLITQSLDSVRFQSLLSYSEFPFFFFWFSSFRPFFGSCFGQLLRTGTAAQPSPRLSRGGRVRKSAMAVTFPRWHRSNLIYITYIYIYIYNIYNIYNIYMYITYIYITYIYNICIYMYICTYIIPNRGLLLGIPLFDMI